MAAWQRQMMADPYGGESGGQIEVWYNPQTGQTINSAEQMAALFDPATMYGEMQMDAGNVDQPGGGWSWNGVPLSPDQIGAAQHAQTAARWAELKAFIDSVPGTAYDKAQAVQQVWGREGMDMLATDGAESLLGIQPGHPLDQMIGQSMERLEDTESQSRQDSVNQLAAIALTAPLGVLAGPELAALAGGGMTGGALSGATIGAIGGGVASAGGDSKQLLQGAGTGALGGAITGAALGGLDLGGSTTSSTGSGLDLLAETNTGTMTDVSGGLYTGGSENVIDLGNGVSMDLTTGDTFNTGTNLVTGSNTYTLASDNTLGTEYLENAGGGSTTQTTGNGGDEFGQNFEQQYNNEYGNSTTTVEGGDYQNTGNNTTTGGGGNTVTTATGVGAGSYLDRILAGTASAGDWAQLLGGLGAAGLGYAGAEQLADAYNSIGNQQLGLQREWMGYGAPYRDLLSQYTQDPNKFINSPGVQASVNQGTNALARALSVNGNPAGSGTALHELQNYATDSLWKQYGAERALLGGLGGLTQYASGATSGNNIAPQMAGANADAGGYNAIGWGLNNVLNPTRRVQLNIGGLT